MSDAMNRSGFPDGHPYRVLPEAVIRLLLTPALPSQNYFAGTVVLTANLADGRGVGSGFVIRVGETPPNGQPTFFLVTAQHNVRPVLRANGTISAQIIRNYDPKKPIQDRYSLALPNGRWIHNERSDVSIVPLPIDDLPEDHSLTAISDVELASRKFGFLLHQGGELKAYGAWSVQTGSALPIERTVYLATLERPTVPIEIEGAERRVEVYIAEGTVSRGMSGGPVSYLASGWAGSGILGLIQGFWPMSEGDIMSGKSSVHRDERTRALAEIRRDIAAINSGILYIVPVWDIDQLLTDAGYPRPDKVGGTGM